MTSLYTVPLIAQPQKLQVQLGGSSYQLTLLYRDTPQGGWTIDIADTVGNPILEGLPLVTGANLLDQFDYLDFGGELWVQTTSDPDAVPTFENLGADGVLYWVTP